MWASRETIARATLSAFPAMSECAPSRMVRSTSSTQIRYSRDAFERLVSGSSVQSLTPPPPHRSPDRGSSDSSRSLHPLGRLGEEGELRQPRSGHGAVAEPDD